MVAVDALYAYLTCGNYDFNYDRMKNLRPRRNIKTAMNHEILMYAIAQKEELGFDKAVEECKYRMSRYGVTPNVRFTSIRTYTQPISMSSRWSHTSVCLRRCSSCRRSSCCISPLPQRPRSRAPRLIKPTWHPHL